MLYKTSTTRINLKSRYLMPSLEPSKLIFDSSHLKPFWFPYLTAYGFGHLLTNMHLAER